MEAIQGRDRMKNCSVVSDCRVANLSVKVDAIVSSVNRMGVFADVGPLPVFVSNHLIPSEIKWDPNATPPQYTDNGDQVIEKGTHLRIKLIGTRSDVGSMFAIGSVKEDFLG
jgi:DNA-directed RNA polymerase II subunit RPB7